MFDILVGNPPAFFYILLSILKYKNDYMIFPWLFINKKENLN